ncbi:MAG: glycoside hydrolase family protein [Anaerolineae bacterium]
MIKFLFFDNRDFELVQGFRRQLQQARKHEGNPLFTADRPWENGNYQLYGSVVKVPDRPFQLWYSTIEPAWHVLMGYAESDDGIVWRKPALDIHRHGGEKTNVVFTAHPHGPSIIYDPWDVRPDWQYKMVCGAEPSEYVYAYHSEDGQHWLPARVDPVIGNNPDCPMSLHRRNDGTYVAYHRVPGGGRRIGRSESADFLDWHGGRIVLEPGPGDPPQFQMYGMGVTMYGNYEIGTLWAYHTDIEDMGGSKMDGYQEAEFTYSRNGLAWHRAAQGEAFIPHGEDGNWDSGNLQCASAPVFLEDEIRYYFAASTIRHSPRWELHPSRFGIGVASLRPDRFIALVAGDEPATMYTRRFTIHSPEVYVNADVAPGGSVRLELLDADARPIPGYGADDCLPVGGDSTAHRVAWRGEPDASAIVGKPIRWRLSATRAKVYSVWMPDGEAVTCYHRFQSI